MKISKEIRTFLSECGKKGGSVKSEKKTLAVRENGKKGGRPPTKPTGGNGNESTGNQHQ